MTARDIVHDSHTLFFDVDSTLITIEGIDELARHKGIYEEISIMTKNSMNGNVRFEDIFEKRLSLIQPRKEDLEWLGTYCVENITPGAKECVTRLLQLKKNVYIISGGYTEAIYAVADTLKIPRENAYANRLIFNENGEYVGFDSEIPLWRSDGKTEIIHSLKPKLVGKSVFIGDGMSDYEASRQLDAFICFTGVIRRENVAKKTIYTCHNFKDLV